MLSRREIAADRTCDGDVGLAERALADGEAFFIEGNGLLVVADPAVQDREVVERHAHVRVPLAEDLMCICMYVCMYVWMDGWMDGWMVENAVCTSGLCCLQGNRQRRRASVDSQQ